MKRFKVEASRLAESYPIDRATVQNVTHGQAPFVQQDNRTHKLSYYGICPSCLNPIQLIGISHKIKYAPHGKHTGNTIEGLRTWNQAKYEYCPYAAKEAYHAPEDSALLPDIDESVIELYDLLKENFDSVVYVIERTLHIKCSVHFWREALKQYCANMFYCYPWLTECNLPYIFAMLGMTQKRIFRQNVEVGSALYHFLSEQDRIELSASDKRYAVIQNKNWQYFDFVFRFTNHQQKGETGKNLYETMDFCIDDNGDIKVFAKELYHETITFEEDFFKNVMQSERRFRRNDLLQVAAEIMTPLHIETE